MGFGALEKKDPVLGKLPKTVLIMLVLICVSAGHSLVKEFAKYRYGVFEEQGYFNDPVYPLCFKDGDTVKITGCSDFQINDNG